MQLDAWAAFSYQETLHTMKNYYKGQRRLKDLLIVAVVTHTHIRMPIYRYLQLCVCMCVVAELRF